MFQADPQHHPPRQPDGPKELQAPANSARIIALALRRTTRGNHAWRAGRLRLERRVALGCVSGHSELVRPPLDVQGAMPFSGWQPGPSARVAPV